MRRRRLASEKESWWGCRLSNSSTITTAGSCPEHESGRGAGRVEKKKGEGGEGLRGGRMKKRSRWVWERGRELESGVKEEKREER